VAREGAGSGEHDPARRRRWRSARTRGQPQWARDRVLAALGDLLDRRACSTTAQAWRTISSPGGVTLSSLPPRSESFTSSSSSSFLIATLSVG